MPVGLIIGGVATVASAAISAGASNHAANVAKDAAAANNALQADIYSKNSALEQPYIGAGNTANDALQGFLGLGGDPAKTQKAFNDYLGSTGYQFERQQGIDSAEQSASAQGLLHSGAALKALQDRGTGLANAFGQQYVDNLGTIANRGASSANALAGVGSTYAGAVSSNNNNAASAAANAGLTSAGQINGLIGNAFTAYGANRGATSFGGGAAAANAYGASPGAYTGVDPLANPFGGPG